MTHLIRLESKTNRQHKKGPAHPLPRSGDRAWRWRGPVRGHSDSAAEATGQEHQPGCSLPGPAPGFLPGPRGEKRGGTGCPPSGRCDSSNSMLPSDWPYSESGDTPAVGHACQACLASCPRLPHYFPASWGHWAQPPHRYILSSLDLPD